MPKKPTGRMYMVQKRYDYWAIDVYQDDSMLRTIQTFKTKKMAENIANALNEAYYAGYDKAIKDIQNG